MSKSYSDKMNALDLSVLDNRIQENLQRCYEYLISRKSTETISVDKEIVFIELCTTLKALSGARKEYNDLLDELYNSVFGRQKTSSKYLVTNHRLEEKIIYDGEMTILKRLYRKRKTTVSWIFRKNSSSVDILDYIWLRKHGYLIRSRDGRLIVDKSIYSEKLDSMFKREIELQDLFKYLKEIPSALWSKIIDQKMLSRMSIEKLLRFTNLYYGYNVRIDKTIRAELRKRINEGLISSPNSWRKLGQIAEKTRLAHDNYLGPYTLEYLRKKIWGDDADKIAKDIQKLPIHERMRIASKIYRNVGLEEILARLDLFTLSSISNPGKIRNDLLKSKAFLGKALAAYVDYLITGNPAYIDYSFMFLDKIEPYNLSPELIPLYESLLKQDKMNIIKLLSSKASEAIEYIGYRIFDLIRTERQISDEVLRRAIILSRKILMKIIRGDTKSKKYIESIYSGKLNIRKTLYNFIRYNYVIARRDRKRIQRITALIDVSGSMLRYSIWALLSLGTVFPLLKYCILFSDRVRIYKVGHYSPISLMSRFLNHVFLEGFKGYTNIALTVERAIEVSKPGDSIVLFTDLEQTVDYKDPVEVIERANKIGRRIIVFVPPFHREDVAFELSSRGVEVVCIGSPEELPRLLGKKLNLKIRDKLIHVRG